MNLSKVSVEYPLSEKFDVDVTATAGFDLDNVLEYVFARMNAGSSREGPELSGRRSLSVGDIVTVEGMHFLCGGIGWTKMTPETRERYLGACKHESDRLEKGGFVDGILDPAKRASTLGWCAQSRTAFYYDKSHEEI